MRPRDDQLGLPPCLLAHLGPGLLGGKQRVREQLLAARELLRLLLEVLDEVGQLAALAPDLFEAVGDLEEKLLDDIALVAEKATADADVSQLDRFITHLSSPSSRACSATSAQDLPPLPR